MTLLSIDEIKALVEQSKGLCVSVYMPTEKLGRETRQNSIRFKNLMKEAEAQLDQAQLRHTTALDFLRPAHELDRDEFWQHQDDGLALFITDGFFRYYRLPLPFEEFVAVSDQFHLKPLMPLLSGDGLFYVLTLSQQQIQLFACTQHGLSQVELTDVPQSVDEALQNDRAEDIQYRVNTSKGGTDNSFTRSGSYHGVGNPDMDRDKEFILQFFHQVDRGLQTVLQGQNAPLVLAGVEYLLPIYRQANTYPNLIEEGITGNSENLKPEELHEQVWPIVEPHFQQSQDAAIELYRELAGTGQTSTELQEAVTAAYYGRVDRLFVANGQQQWGRFDTETNQLEVHSDMKPGDEDLLNMAAIQTILNGGTVYAVEPEQVPESAPLAAVFRY
ncbi:hypothetical protein IQ268_26185 [Oculatella sp. LEGE 06141]|uniref:baeRF3 domain-containing protein n=1 Tax=Oculatella sp. LEGE 06141 TaxID=1828648 RepID=UPI00187EDA6B|nr:hypothetical protein [Oculatella sp. LEGE 06141]MBE9182059.1 hypothetical protein [Oculatella sp. LEGE 06141]